MTKILLKLCIKVNGILKDVDYANVVVLFVCFVKVICLLKSELLLLVKCEL